VPLGLRNGELAGHVVAELAGYCPADCGCATRDVLGHLDGSRVRLRRYRHSL
jgi:hypothetical protein